MILYPLLSVLPQEILFRVCLTDILEAICRGRLLPALPMLGSALLFGWAHIIYAGYVALGATCLAGLALAWNYRRNRKQPGALWPLLLEHALSGKLSLPPASATTFTCCAARRSDKRAGKGEPPPEP